MEPCFIVLHILLLHLQISGEFAKVKDAVYNVTSRLRDNLFSSSLQNAGTRSTSSVLADTSPYGRLRDSASVGLPSSVGVSHTVSGHPTITQSIDHTGLSRSLDRPPSPRLWTSQVESLSHPLTHKKYFYIKIFSGLYSYNSLLIVGFDCRQ